MTNITITLQSIEGISRDRLVEAFNLAYADYFVPIHLTAESLDRLIERESLTLTGSVVALSGDDVVGTGMLGVRGSRGWIGMIGVIPDYRSHGIARRIMDWLIEQAGQRNLHTLQLEVIIQNKHACDLYESLGFITRRHLLVMFRSATNPPVVSTGSEKLALRSIPAEVGIQKLEALSTVTLPWQRETSSLYPIAGKLEGLAVATEIDDHLLGCALYRAEEDHGAILGVAASSTETAEFLLDSVLRLHPEADFSYVNVPDDDPLVSRLHEVGFEETLSQYEMFLTLDAGQVG